MRTSVHNKFSASISSKDFIETTHRSSAKSIVKLGETVQDGQLIADIEEGLLVQKFTHQFPEESLTFLMSL